MRALAPPVQFALKMALQIALKIAAIAVAVTSVATPVWSQQGGDPPPSLFIDTVDVDIVNVEVFVTDRKGQRVTDLGVDDFRLFEDGTEVEIANFYSSFRDSFAVRSAEQGAPLADSPSAPASTAPEQRLHLAVYVDHLSLRPVNRKRVLEALEGLVEDRLREGDRITLIGYDGALDIVEPWTTEANALREGLSRMAKVSAIRRADDGLRTRMQRLMIQAQADVPPDPQSALSYLRTYAQAVESDVQRATGALKSAVRSMSGLPGRKALLYVSDGWPMRPGEDLYQFYLDLFGATGLRGSVINPTAEIQRYDQSHRFEAISREAHAQQVTLYAIDARGSSIGGLKADNQGLTASPGGATLTEAQRTEGAREGLFSIALSTGGSVAFETFDFANVFDTLGEDFNGFYSLGFRSRQAGDDRLHEIEVEVTRPDVAVRHRRGYLDKPPVDRVADRTLAALMLGAGQNPLNVAVKLGEPVPGKGRTWMLPVLVAVPIGAVTVVPDGDQLRGKLRFILTVQDDNGVSEPHTETYPVDLPADGYEAARSQSLGFSARLQVRPGTPTVAVGVWDEIADSESIVLEQAVVGKLKRR